MKRAAFVTGVIALGVLGYLYVSSHQQQAYPPVGNVCFDQLASALGSARASASVVVPDFTDAGVSIVHCSAAPGFVAFEMAGIDTEGQEFHLYERAGGRAASGADSIFDYCYTRAGTVISQTRESGREGVVSASACSYSAIAQHEPTDTYEFSK